jgi:hypothetical protein
MNCITAEEPGIAALPASVKPLLAALASQYDHLPAEPCIGAALAVLTVAAGPVTLDTRLSTPIMPTFRIIMALEGESLVVDAISQILAPLRTYEAQSLAAAGSLDVAMVEEEIATLRRELTATALTQRFPDAAHEAAIKRRIAEATALLRRAVITENPWGGRVADALRQSADEQVCLASLDLNRTQRLIEHWVSEKGADEVALMDAASRGCPYIGPAGSFARPGVNALLLCNPTTLRAFAGAGARVPFFWLMDATNAKTRLRRMRDDDTAAAWEQFIHSLLDRRFASGARPITVADEVFQFLGRKLNATAERGSVPTVNRAERGPVHDVASLAAILHAAEQGTHVPLALATVDRAVTLARALQAHRRAVQQASAETLLIHFVKEEVVEEPGAWLTLKQLKGGLAAYSKAKDGGAPVPEPTRREIAAAVREMRQARMRNDLPGGLGDTRGWKHLGLRPAT